MRDSRKKEAGMRDQEPPFQTVLDAREVRREQKKDARGGGEGFARNRRNPWWNEYRARN